MVNPTTVAELAEDAFVKGDYYAALQQANTPSDYEERKKGFIRLKVAEAAYLEASRKLNAFKNGDKRD